jgi:predicted DNA-binding transcriptional regulator AlpA
VANSAWGFAEVNHVKRYIRYADIKARGIANNRVTLENLIAQHGFPEGIFLSPMVRAWDEPEVDEWLASRPAAKDAKPPLRGIVKHLAERQTDTAPRRVRPRT